MRLLVFALSLLALAGAAEAACTPTGVPTTAARLDTQTADQVKITGGCIDGTPIGQNTPAAGSFTTLTVLSVAYNPTDPAYGAACDWNGTAGTDDTTAFNAMFAAIRTAGKPFTVVAPENKQCLIEGTVNATGFSEYSNTLGFGSSIQLRLYCKTSGAPCVDGYDTRFVQWDLVLNANATLSGTSPNIGLQVGECSNPTAGLNTFKRLDIKGAYSFASFVNTSGENYSYYHPFIENTATGAGRYAAVLDGYNAWAIDSTFVTCTRAENTYTSFNEQLFFGGSIETVGASLSGTSAPLWIGGANHIRFHGVYLATNGDYAAVIYNKIGQTKMTDAMFDVHVETTSIDNVFLLTGDAVTTTLANLTYRDQRPQALTSIFKIDSGSSITAVDMPGLRIEVPGSTVSTLKLWDQPSKYTAAGWVYLPGSVNWEAPAEFNGTLCTPDCVHVQPTEAFNLNPNFVIDQPNEGNVHTPGSNSLPLIDGWYRRAAGAGWDISWQRLSGGGETYTNYLRGLVVSTKAVGAAEYYIGRSPVEGIEIADLKWGTADAKPIACKVEMRANNTGTYNFAILNSALNRSRVMEVALTANTWATKTLYIPGDTSGTWTDDPHGIGMWLVVAPSVGTDLRTTADTWAAGEFYGTSAIFDFANTASARLDVGYVHCFQATVDMPYKARPYDVELRRAQRWYQKTFNALVQVAQNAGTVGALVKRAPWAFGTVAALDIPWHMPVEMFMSASNPANVPVITTYSTGAASSQCYNVTQAAAEGAATVKFQSNRSVVIECALTAAVVGDEIAVHATARAQGP